MVLSLEEWVVKADKANHKVETQHRRVIPMDKRYLEIVPSESSNIRLTINSSTGRFTLKFPEKSSEAVKAEITKIVLKIIQEDETLPPVSLRGKIHWDHKDEEYKCYLQSDSKKFNGWIIKNSQPFRFGDNNNV